MFRGGRAMGCLERGGVERFEREGRMRKYVGRFMQERMWGTYSD